MNAYIIVEGEKTEMSVYPAWMSLIAPNMQHIDDPQALSSDSYYLFSGHGQPSVFQHVSGAIKDINYINSRNDNKYDYLIVCVDTEDETPEYIRQQIDKYIQQENVTLCDECKLVIFEQKVCMETWFLGNCKVFKSNPTGDRMIQYLRYYNVKNNDPENMGAFDEERYTKAQFHVRYLKEMLKERNIKYEKNDPSVVCNKSYLDEIIKRYEDTDHLQTFGSWYEFVKKNLANPSTLGNQR